MGRGELKLREKLQAARRRSSSKSLAVSQDATTVVSSIPTTTFGGGDAISETASIDNSMQELVAFDEEGHPFIDINKLAFKPRKKHHDHQKEKLSWYVPDFTFIVFNFMSLGCSTYFVLIGNTTLTWKSSIGMFSLPNCYAIHGYNNTNGTRFLTGNDPLVKDFFFAPCEIFLHEKPFWDDAYQEPGEGYNFSVPGSHPILRTKLTDVHYFGLVLICFSFVNALNVCVGINACLQGYKTLLYGHMAVDGVIVLVEFIICAAVHFTGRCEDKDIEIIRVVLQHFIRWYGLTQKGIESESAKEKLLTTEVDSLQIGLACCGADGWQDYLGFDKNHPMSGLANYKAEIEETESVIPFSCCRPWWIRNIYCAHGVHRWSHPLASPDRALQFHERINQDSCIYKLEKMCYKIKSLMGVQGFITTFVHLAFIIMEAVSALILIRNINNIIREKKRINKEKEINTDGVDSMDDFDAMDGDSSATNLRKSVGILTKVPPPTEDEIITIKQRTNFNQFITKVKTSHVGTWMRQAQEKVTEGHDEEEEMVKLTAAEKKAREKELLHKAKAARIEDDAASDEHGHRHHHRHHQPHQTPLNPLENSPSGGKEDDKMTPKPERKKKLKIKSKLDTGTILKRKSRKTLIGLGGEEEALKRKSAKKSLHPAPEGVEEPAHMEDEGYQIPEEVDTKISKITTKYVKQKGKKSLKKVGPSSSSHTLINGPPRKSKVGRKSVKGKKEKGAENVDSTTVLWQKEDGEKEGEGEPNQADASVGVDEKEREAEEVESEAGAVGSDETGSKPKKKLKKKTSKSLKAKRSKGSTATVSKRQTRSSAGSGSESESSWDEAEDDSEEKHRRKRSRKKSRKKRIKAAKKKRDTNKFRPKGPWFAYF